MQDRRNYHHGYLRERLLELGEAALRDNKLDQTSLRDLAKQAGVSHSAPYRHFSDREALELALLEKEMRNLLETTATIDKDPHITELNRFKELGKKLISLSANNPHRFVLLMSAKTKQHSQPLTDTKAAISRVLIRWTVEELRRSGLRQKLEPMVALKSIWACIAGAIQVGQSHWTRDSQLDSRDEAFVILDNSLSAIFKA